MTAPAGIVAVRRAEPWIVWLLAAAALASIPIVQGQSSIIWDALNHHIYLGWIAERPRWEKDFLAAGWQSFQYPYLYWPAYKLAAAGVSGVTAGVVLALMQSLVVPPVWLVARSLCPGERIEDVAWRALAVALALAGGLTLSLVDTTSNDLLAGIPLVWAIALGMMAREPGDRRRARRLIALSGFLAGVSVAFKLSNGPMAVVLTALWALGGGGVRAAMGRAVLGGVLTLAGYAVADAPWAWQLWQQTGNPIFPFAEPLFEIVRQRAHWTPPW